MHRDKALGRDPTHRRRRLFHIVFFVLVGGAISALWHFTPLHAWLNIHHLVALIHRTRHLPATPFWLIGAFLLSGILFFPITLLVVATILGLTPPENFLYVFLGCLASASLNYVLGSYIGTDMIDRLAGARWTKLRLYLQQKSLVTMITVNLLPIAPFSLITLGAGALHLRYRDVMIGAWIGILPSILAITVFAHTLPYLFNQPKPLPLLELTVLLLIMGGFTIGLRRLLRRHTTQTHPSDKT